MVDLVLCMMGAETAIVVAALATSAAATAGSAGMTMAQGEAAAEQAKTEAEMEREAAKTRTDQRLQEVRQFRAAQRVATAAAGVEQGTGSSGAIEKDLESQARAGQYADSYATRWRINQLKAQQTNARRFGYLSGGISLIEGAANVGMTAGRMRRPGTGMVAADRYTY